MTQVVKNNAAEIAKSYLDNHGIKQRYIADKMHVNESVVSNRLTGKRKFTADFAIAFSQIVGIDPTIFLKNSFSK